MKLKGKIAIVTGGAKNIGKAISLRLAQEGATVIVASSSVKTGTDPFVDELKALGAAADSFRMDIAKPQEARDMVKYVFDKYGRIDILVNNSGIAGPTSKLVDVSLEDWLKVFDVNLNGLLVCCQETLKHMIPVRSGNIINISSEGGKSGYPLRGPYSVSKRAVIALTDVLAIEAGEYGIRVNTISPGRTKGPRVDHVIKATSEATGKTPDEILAGMSADVSLKRLIDASEVAAGVVFLASDDASAITGENLSISAGKHMMH
ncbi:MAG: SDR family oxidoreductase [Synergistaceae bacterium]|jgi:NAD(P)-dependent dehydrogenase (short-subunit alcohol dehydrogenase family)|nr:SDR family oxidoreductase [Synergistaceae bacterium]